MSLEIPQFFETDFARNWEMKAQQKDSRLAGAVESTEFKGKRKAFNKLDTGTMTEVTERKGSTPDGDSTGDKYWIYRRKFEFVKRWDEDDQLNLGSVALPDSDEVASFSAAENRTKDDVIIAAFDATRYIGETGVTTDAFDTNFDVAVNYVASGAAANSGLTLAKIAKAKQLLDEAEVDDGDRYFTHSAQQLQDMLLIDKMTSQDYAAVKALVEGKVEKFLGFHFIRTERLSLNASTDVRTCFAWHKSGVKFGYAGRDVHFDILATERHQRQLRGVSRMGAVRTENTKVVRIACDESP
jgi:hypothetical protein